MRFTLRTLCLLQLYLGLAILCLRHPSCWTCAALLVFVASLLSTATLVVLLSCGCYSLDVSRKLGIVCFGAVFLACLPIGEPALSQVFLELSPQTPPTFCGSPEFPMPTTMVSFPPPSPPSVMPAQPPVTVPSADSSCFCRAGILLVAITFSLSGGAVAQCMASRRERDARGT